MDSWEELLWWRANSDSFRQASWRVLTRASDFVRDKRDAEEKEIEKKSMIN